MRTKNVCRFGKKPLPVIIMFMSFILFYDNVNAQNVAITDEEGYSAHATAMLDVYSLSKGMLVPRVALASTDNPISGAKPEGLLVWNTSTTGSYPAPGYYYWSGSDWVKIGGLSLNFQNGLSQSGYDVTLGGTLSSTTTLSVGSSPFRINLTGSGDFDIRDNGSSALFVRDNGCIGIGTDDPQQRLQVDGNIKLDNNLMIEGSSDYRVYRNLASYSVNSTQGAFVINTNHPMSSSCMFRVKIEGYLFNNTGPLEITIGASTVSGNFYYAGYINIGAEKLRVRLAENNSTNNIAIILGEESTTYSYPKLSVTEYYLGFVDIDDRYAEDWSITQETDLTNYVDAIEVSDVTSYDIADLTPGTGISGSVYNGSVARTFSHTDMSSQVSVNNSGGIVIQDITMESLGHVTGIGSYNLDNRYYTETEVDGLVSWDRNTGSGYLFPVNLSDNVGIGTNNPVSRLEVQGNKSGSDENDDPLFEVKRNDGQTVFAVYPQGVRVFVDEDAGATTKGVKGGFAVGGFNTAAKGLTNDYLWVTPDSVRIYIDNNPGSKGVKGGFAVGGFGAQKSDAIDLFHITKENYFIGHGSGVNTTPDEPGPGDGKYNNFFGYQSGFSNTSGERNCFIGYESGYNNTTGTYNVFIGNSAGYYKSDAISNVIIGYYGYPGGLETYGGDFNVMVGNEAGKFNEGSSNVILGDNSGRDSEGGANIMIGFQSGINSIGTGNILMGHMAGMNNQGDYNVLLGQTAGLNNNGDKSVFIGYEAGKNALGSNKLYIENSASNDPLIYGEFDNDLLVFNADRVDLNADTVSIGTPDPLTPFHVQGSIYAATSSAPEKHVALIENSYSTYTRVDILGLKMGSSSNPDSYTNFITFFKGDNTPIGAIEGDGIGGVTLASGSGDYAEYLPIMDPIERFEEGDIVGVYKGKISKVTLNSDFVSAISSRPIVLGNDPGEEKQHLYEKVGFVGTVDVKVKGRVKTGDYIVASGMNDGTGKAVALDEILPRQYSQIVGIAWESSENEDLKLVETAIGLSSWMAPIKKQQEKIDELEKKLEKMDELEQQILELKEYISANK